MYDRILHNSHNSAENLCCPISNNDKEQKRGCRNNHGLVAWLAALTAAPSFPSVYKKEYGYSHYIVMRTFSR